MNAIALTDIDYPALKLHIDGEWLDRGNRRTHAVLNPATGEALAALPLVDAADLDRALAATGQQAAIIDFG